MAQTDITECAIATHVRFWLGTSGDGSNAAMKFISEIRTADFENPNCKLDQNTWIAVKHLVQRQWWSRAWTMQECCLAKNQRSIGVGKLLTGTASLLSYNFQASVKSGMISARRQCSIVSQIHSPSCLRARISTRVCTSEGSQSYKIDHRNYR